MNQAPDVTKESTENITSACCCLSHVKEVHEWFPGEEFRRCKVCGQRWVRAGNVARREEDLSTLHFAAELAVELFVRGTDSSLARIVDDAKHFAAYMQSNGLPIPERFRPKA